MKAASTALSLLFIVSAWQADFRTQKPERPSGKLLIDAVFLDRNGDPVTDVRRDEVEIWISGYRVPMDTFVAVTPGSGVPNERLLALLLDDVTLPLALVARARDIARRFVNRLSPGDEMAIVTLSGAVIETTGERERLLRAVDAFNVRASGVTPFDALSARVLETVAALSRQLAPGPDRRKTIVAIGSGWLFDRPVLPHSVGRDLRAEWTDAMAATAAANVSLYVIEPAGVGSAPAVGGDTGFARETGGHAFLNTNDFEGAVDRIMRDAVSHYLIGATDPPIQRKADLRELDVRVLRKGLSVRARRRIPGTR